MHEPDAPQEPPEIRRKKLQISRKMLKEDSVLMKDVERWWDLDDERRWKLEILLKYVEIGMMKDVEILLKEVEIWMMKDVEILLKEVEI